MKIFNPPAGGGAIPPKNYESRIKNKILPVIFIGIVTFFSLWLKQPVGADLTTCNENCFSQQTRNQMEEECTSTTCEAETSCDISACVSKLTAACQEACASQNPPPAQAPAAPTCTLEKLQELKKSYDIETKQEIKFEPSKILPLCVYFEGTTPELEKTCGCRNINVLVSLLVKIGNWLFGIVGAAALIVFIYGGFTMLTAAGSAERVKKGKDALVAAIIGLVIVFTAQIGLRFLLEKTVLSPAGEPGAHLEKEGLMINMPEK